MLSMTNITQNVLESRLSRLLLETSIPDGENNRESERENLRVCARVFRQHRHSKCE